jgi:two-component system LytT family response regulator
MPSPERLTVLIVDDEPPARRYLAERFQEIERNVRLLEAGDGRDAVRSIRADAPDLVFLDVQMPELSGFDVLREIGADKMPPTVFVTAYDRHAIHAFEAGALDYLLKPFSEKRFEIALARARRRIEDDQLRGFGREALRLLARSEPQVAAPIDRLLVRNGSGMQVVPVSEIDAVAGAGVYVALRVAGRELLHRASLTELGAELGMRFVRIHRSTIVNVDAVVRVEALSHGEFELTLRHGERVRVSRTYRHALEQTLGSLS